MVPSSLTAGVAALLTLSAAEGYYHPVPRGSSLFQRYFDSFFDPFTPSLGLFPFDAPRAPPSRRSPTPYDYLDAAATRQQRRMRALRDMMESRDRALRQYHQRLDQMDGTDKTQESGEEAFGLQSFSPLWSSLWSPGRMGVEEDKDGLSFKLALQGASPTDTQVQVDEDTRLLHIRSKVERKGPHGMLTTSQWFSRSLRLPENVDASSMKLDFNDSGVRINFAKTALSEPEATAAAPAQQSTTPQEPKAEPTAPETATPKAATAASEAPSAPEAAAVQPSSASHAAPYVGSMRVEETEGGLTYDTVMRGIPSTDVKVEVDEKNRVLSLRAEGQNEHQGEGSFFSSSYSYSRSFRLPRNVDPASMKTDFHEGGVRVSFDKSALPEAENPGAAAAPKAVARPPESTAKTPTGPIMEKANKGEAPHEDTTSGEVENL